LDPLPEIIEFAPFRDQLKVLRCGGDAYEGGRLDAAELVRAFGSSCRLDEFGAAVALLTAADLSDLLAGSAFSQLASLDLRDNQIEPDGWEAFRSARLRLRELDLSGTPLGATSLERLLGCAALSELRVLHLNRCGTTPANIRALASSRFWSQAEELRMQHGTYWTGDFEDGEEMPAGTTGASLDPLFAAPGPSNLRVLDVSGHALRDAGVAQLCEARWAGSLAYLDLSRNLLSDDALRTMVKSGRFKNLHTLHLDYNSPHYQQGAESHESITSAGLRALAECPDFANLRVLSVSGLHITAAGADTILSSLHWRLSGLRLENCQLDDDALRVLANSTALSRLEVLTLSNNNEVSSNGLMPLAESGNLSPCTELDVSGIYLSDKTRGELRARLGRRLSE
ncbi:MAG: hypothetical protein L0241_18340, partial [Planctomycetia bacterium]|nr:hypothetical protein [Planctomycetia bacterium]